MMTRLLYDQIIKIFDSIDTPMPNIRATELYCEGWLLRLALSAAERGIPCLPFIFEEGSRWFAEPKLYSPFCLWRNPNGEAHTDADAVVGQFDFGSTKTGLALTRSATQFNVIEGKIYSELSKGTKNARNYDQAARIVACMAQVLANAERPITSYRKLGFTVIAPEERIQQGKFKTQLDRDYMRRQIVQRTDSFDNVHCFFDEWACPLLEQVEIQCISWEEIIERLAAADQSFGGELREFYKKCLRYAKDPCE